ncbi:hypothetical protein ACIRQP_38805 [Streptomyces sp. NPDC102274]|uniref:hypothetical protein n=1 Tax=Streptomyces sp. NPDC102274 TaxID=3366151 RepID=UPI003816F77E
MTAGQIHAFRRGTWQSSLDEAQLPGDPGVRLALVPEVVAAADRRWWDAAFPCLPPAPADRRALLLRALDLFEQGDLTVGGLGSQSGDDFRSALWRTAGLPAPLVDRWSGMLRSGLMARHQLSLDGELTLISLPGNTFTCLAAVLEQVQSSDAVWVRPSRREPLSAARLVAALLAAGWPAERIGFYPSEQRALGGLIRLTDRHVIFGGVGLAASVRSSAALTLHGPGRGCALVPAGVAAREAADWLLPLIAADSGRFCSNVRTVVCSGPAEPLATYLAATLDAIDPQLPDNAWPLVAFRQPGSAQRAARSVTDRMRPGDRILTRRPPVLETLGGDTYVLPQLVLMEDSAALFDGEDQQHESQSLIGHEVPFPYATVVSATGRDAAAIAAEALFVYRPPSDGEAQRGTL